MPYKMFKQTTMVVAWLATLEEGNTEVQLENALLLPSDSLKFFNLQVLSCINCNHEGQSYLIMRQQEHAKAIG
jgi:hypothetical protein